MWNSPGDTSACHGAPPTVHVCSGHSNCAISQPGAVDVQDGETPVCQMGLVVRSGAAVQSPTDPSNFVSTVTPFPYPGCGLGGVGQLLVHSFGNTLDGVLLDGGQRVGREALLLLGRPAPFLSSHHKQFSALVKSLERSSLGPAM